MKKRFVVFKDRIVGIVNEMDRGSLVWESDGDSLLSALDCLYSIERECVFLLAKSELWGIITQRSDFSIRRYLNGIEELERAGWIVVTTNKEGVEVLFPSKMFLDRYVGTSYDLPKVIEAEDNDD